jgi:hypothetical protein
VAEGAEAGIRLLTFDELARLVVGADPKWSCMITVAPKTRLSARRLGKRDDRAATVGRRLDLLDAVRIFWRSWLNSESAELSTTEPISGLEITRELARVDSRESRLQ